MGISIFIEFVVILYKMDDIVIISGRLESFARCTHWLLGIDEEEK